MTDVTMARYPTAYLQAKALRSAVFLADSFLLLHQHRRIKRDWRPLHLLRRKLFGQVRLRGFGKWSLIVATVEDKMLFRNCANRGLWQIWQFFAFFLITNYRRRVVCFLFQIHLDLTCVLSLENLYSTSVCLGRCLLRVASWLLPDQCQAFLYKELKRHPLNVVHKVGAYYYVLSVAPTRKLSVAPTKKPQNNNKQTTEKGTFSWLVCFYFPSKIKESVRGSLKFPDRMQIKVNNFFWKKIRN